MWRSNKAPPPPQPTRPMERVPMRSEPAKQIERAPPRSEPEADKADTWRATGRPSAPIQQQQQPAPVRAFTRDLPARGEQENPWRRPAAPSQPAAAVPAPAPAAQRSATTPAPPAGAAPAKARYVPPHLRQQQQ